MTQLLNLNKLTTFVTILNTNFYDECFHHIETGQFFRIAILRITVEHCRRSQDKILVSFQRCS